LKEEKAMTETGRKDKMQEDKVQAGIDALSRRLEKAQAETEQSILQIIRDTEATAKVLQGEAAKAHGEAKAHIKAQIDALGKQYEKAAAQLRKVTAETLTEAAATLRKAG
jgi:hypothetical protein